MIRSSSSRKIFSSPTSSRSAAQAYYSVMCVGMIFVPMLFLILYKYIESHFAIDIKEFFLIFTIIYIFILIFCKKQATNITSRLRSQLNPQLPLEVTILAPAAANSLDQEVRLCGEKYWFWQLISGYLMGVYFSWVVGIFIIFII